MLIHKKISRLVEVMQVEKKQFDNGDVYEGEMLLGLPFGTGKMIFSQGHVYTGSWKKGIMHGNGELKLNNNVILKGEFWRGKIDGQGEMLEADHKQYQGTMKEGKFHGQGQLQLANGVFQGSWRGGSPCGRGKLLQKGQLLKEGFWWQNKFISEQTPPVKEGSFAYKGGTYQGEYLAVDALKIPHGQGQAKLEKGLEFKGNWYLGEMTAQGEIIYADGQVYQGELLYGRYHGYGFLQLNQQGYYQGEWARGVREGQGKMVLEDGSCYQGGYSDNERHGKGENKYSDQSIYRGQWFYDLRHGEGELIDAQGNKKSGYWEYDHFKG